MKCIIKIRKRRQKFEMLRPKSKIKKMYWEFHKGDADINPSVPHGHSLDGKYEFVEKFSVGLVFFTGLLYTVTKSTMGNWNCRTSELGSAK